MNNENENKYKKLLEVGQVFKSYRDISRYLGEKIKSGNSKDAQVKEWECHFKYDKEGHKYIITEIYNTPLPKIDLRSKGGNTLKMPLLETHPELVSEWMKEKNNMEIPSSITRRTKIKFWWKCKRCKLEIYTSPRSRTTNPNNNCYHCGLSNNAKKVYQFLREVGVELELEYTFSELKGLGGGVLRFDFAILSHGKLVGLIEYDGEFHDEEYNTDKEAFDVQTLHDQMKDEYCEKNNIPLLRIHHSKIDFHKITIYKHFQEIGMTHLIPKGFNKIEQYQDELTLIENTIKELEEKASHLQGKLEGWA